MRFASLLLALALVSVATPGPATAPDKTPTFAADIAPIVYANCAGCHRPGQAGPFPLLSYDDVKKHADGIVEATSKREMPPWHATRADGFPEYRDERRLSSDEVDTIRKWVDGGTPAGDMKKAPKPPVFPYGWALGVRMSF